LTGINAHRKKVADEMVQKMLAVPEEQFIINSVTMDGYMHRAGMVQKPVSLIKKIINFAVLRLL
jgi:hypothetical protein